MEGHRTHLSPGVLFPRFTQRLDSFQAFCYLHLHCFQPTPLSQLLLNLPHLLSAPPHTPLNSQRKLLLSVDQADKLLSTPNSKSPKCCNKMYVPVVVGQATHSLRLVVAYLRSV